LVLERAVDSFNHLAVLRTAEGFGIQNIWVVEDPNYEERSARTSHSVTKGTHHWLSIRNFQSPQDCLVALQEEGWTIWATDLGRVAEPLTSDALLPFPEKVAIVLGRESDGVSDLMLEAADRRFYLPMHGFADSFNLTVATGLMLQKVFLACPEAHGDLSETQLADLRLDWYRKLATNDERWKEYRQWLNNPPEPEPDLRPEEAMRQVRTLKKFRNKAR
jgi:tRNA (guanosine-2'-O-)-methyltransferase